VNTQTQATEFSEKSLTAQQQQVLLAEYDACLRTVLQLQSNIWQSAALFITLSTAGLSFVMQSTAKTRDEHLIRVVAALVPPIILAIWQRILSRWNAVQLLEFARMSQIEQILKMQRQLNHDYARNFNRGKSINGNRTDVQPIDSFIVKRYGKRNSYTYLSWAIWFLCVLWVIVAIIEASRIF